MKQNQLVQDHAINASFEKNEKEADHFITLQSQSAVEGLKPDYIDQNHWDEWLKSGVSPGMTARNVISPTVEQGYELLLYSLRLNRRNDGRLRDGDLKRYSHIEQGGWWCAGVDPLLDYKLMLWGCFKPNQPLTDGSTGRIIKYEHPYKEATRAFLLQVPGAEWELVSSKCGIPIIDSDRARGFWYWVWRCNVPIIITEGAKKAASLLSHGYAAIGLPGIYGGARNPKDDQGRAIGHPYLIPELQHFATLGRIIKICFDYDDRPKTRDAIQNASSQLCKLLSPSGANLSVMLLPGPDKGVDDFIVAGGDLNELYQNAPTFSQWTELLKAERSILKGASNTTLAAYLGFGDDIACKENGEPESKMISLTLKLYAKWGERIRYNEMLQRMELDGKHLRIDFIKSTIGGAIGADVSREVAVEACLRLAERNTYHPVQEYLESLSPCTDNSILDNIALRHFGNPDPLASIYMRKLLIASVARIYDPGCKVDTMTILIDPKQGTGKSTYWRMLFGTPWFTDSLQDLANKDELAKLKRFWGLEIAEADFLFSQKAVEQFKRFLSAQEDTYRPPYGRENFTSPRTCVFVGSSNKRDLLNDPTGSRRFWLIDVFGKIPVQLLAEERDELWASAVAAYNSGERYWLTESEDRECAERNLQYQDTDPWFELVMRKFGGALEVNPRDIYSVLEFETNQIDKKVQNRIGGIMRQLGFDYKPKRIDGVLVKRWLRTVTQVPTEMSNKMSNTDESIYSNGSGISAPNMTLEMSNKMSNTSEAIYSNGSGDLKSDCYSSYSSIPDILKKEETTEKTNNARSFAPSNTDEKFDSSLKMSNRDNKDAQDVEGEPTLGVTHLCNSSQVTVELSNRPEGETTPLPPVGSWVMIQSQPALVTEHKGYSHVFLDGEPAGNMAYGSYPASECTPLCKKELIALGVKL